MNDEDSKILETVIAQLGKPCQRCSQRVGGEDLIYSIALGFKNSPRCLWALADGLHRAENELRLELQAYIHRRECYQRAWEAISSWADADRQTVECGLEQPRQKPELSAQMSVDKTARWDAGDMSCGDLVLELRKRVKKLPPGGTIFLTALDPAAPVDLPAWCGLTGHRLVWADHPHYIIARKET